MEMEGGYVAYVHKYAGKTAMGVIQPTRRWSGPHEIYDEGVTVTFRDHLFVTNDEKLIKAMDVHPKYGVTFKRVESGEDYERILRHGSTAVKFERGPATTIAEKLGAPRTVPPDMTRIEEIAPSPEVAALPEERLPKFQRRSKK